ncbi:MAG: arylamine N-acetyltransferase [Clostridiales bacterium]|nr:arylamine N-acetyltransferase [Clostridiales bacterium]
MGMMSYADRYGKYFEALPDVDAYMERIGLEGKSIPLTKEGLDTMQFAHLRAVPFENIDLWDYNKPVDYGVPELWDKVILRRRGGYCFELNALYMALLQALGFDCYAVGARSVPYNDRGIEPPYMHRMTVVTMGGKRYVTDVGFGFTNSARASICLDEYGEQDIRGTKHTVEDMQGNTKLVIRHGAEGPAHVFKFSMHPIPILDFIGPNYYMSAIGFRNKRMVNLHTLEGAVTIDGAVLRETAGGIVTETPAATALETLKILNERFGMVIREPLRDEAELPPA